MADSTEATTNAATRKEMERKKGEKTTKKAFAETQAHTMRLEMKQKKQRQQQHIVELFCRERKREKTKEQKRLLNSLEIRIMGKTIFLVRVCVCSSCVDEESEHTMGKGCEV